MVLTDGQWAVLGLLVEACRPHAKVPPSDLRCTVEAIVWRCRNGATWRAVVEGGAGVHPLGPARGLARLLDMANERGVQLGMAFLDGTNIRAHAKAAGASEKGNLGRNATLVRRLAEAVEAMAPRPS